MNHTTNKEILLRAENIRVHYGGVQALDGASIQIDEGEIVALMGPNGAGKSTLLKAIFGIAPIESGKILWHEKEVAPVPHEMVARGISFVPQGRRVFKHLSVKENLEVGGYVLPNKKELPERIADVLDIFPPLKAKLANASGSLSGGQQQMLALARGLIIDPKILLLDEPSLGLSPKFVKEVFEKVQEINEKRKTAIVIVEHNIKSILGIVTRAYILDKGKVAREGDPHTLIESGILEKVFLGKI